MIEIIKTIEYQNFGFNALTIAAGATIIFSLIKGYGIISQGLKIWKNKSGENVSAIFFFYNFFFFLLFLNYGIEEKSLAITVSGALSILYLPILFGLKKYRGFSKKEIYFAILMSFIFLLSFLFDKSHMILVFSIIATMAIFSQIKEIWKEKKFGAFSVRYLQTFLAATLFWGIYYVMTQNWLLSILNAVEIVLFTTALILEKRWREKK